MVTGLEAVLDMVMTKVPPSGPLSDKMESPTATVTIGGGEAMTVKVAEFEVADPPLLLTKHLYLAPLMPVIDGANRDRITSWIQEARISIDIQESGRRWPRH